MRHLLLLLLGLSLLIVSCGGSDSDEDMSSLTSGTMTVVKNGESFTITEGFNNTLLHIDPNDTANGRRLDIRCTVDGGAFTLIVTNTHFQNPPDNGILEKTYDTNLMGANSDCEMVTNNATFCDVGEANYSLDNVYYVSDFGIEPIEGVITITENDNDNQTLSGTFDVVVSDFSTFDNPEEITFSGSFDNLSYIVTQ